MAAPIVLEAQTVFPEAKHEMFEWVALKNEEKIPQSKNTNLSSNFFL